MNCTIHKTNGTKCTKWAEMVVGSSAFGVFVCRQHVGSAVTAALNGVGTSVPFGVVSVYGIADWRAEVAI